MALLQLNAIEGELSPGEITSQTIARVKTLRADNGFAISAVCDDLGGHGFAVKEENASKVETSKRIVDISLELGTNI